jgi:hypothetical protein
VPKYIMLPMMMLVREISMPDDVDRAAAPNMSTFLVAVSGIVGAVGGAKKNAQRLSDSCRLYHRLNGPGILGPAT